MEAPGKEVHGSYFWRAVFAVFLMIFVVSIIAFWNTIKGWLQTLGNLGNTAASVSGDISNQVSGANVTTVPGYKPNGWQVLTALQTNPNPFASGYTPTSSINTSDPNYQSLYSQFQQNIFPTFFQGLNPGNWFTGDNTLIALFQQVPTLDTLNQINKDCIAAGNQSISIILTGHLDQQGLDAIAAVINSKQ